MRVLCFGAVASSLLLCVQISSATANPATFVLPQAHPGVAYSAQLSIPPGLGYPFAICSLTGLPIGLKFDCAHLKITGRTLAGIEKSYDLALELSDANGNNKSFNLTLRVSSNPELVNLAIQAPAAGSQSSIVPTAQPPAAHAQSPMAGTLLAGSTGAEQQPSAPAGPQSVHVPAQTDEEQGASAARLQMAVAKLRPMLIAAAMHSPQAGIQPATALDQTPPTGGNSTPATPSGCKNLNANGIFSKEEGSAWKDLEDVTTGPHCSSKPDPLSDSDCSKYVTHLTKLYQDAESAQKALSTEAKNTGSSDPCQSLYTARAKAWGDLATAMDGDPGETASGKYQIPPSQLSEFLPNVGVPPSGPWTAPVGTAVAGLDISGASSTDYQANFLGGIMADIPFYGSPNASLDAVNWWLGGQFRLGGMAQPGALTGNIGSLTSFGTYLAAAVNATPDRIVQSIEGSFDAAYKFQRWSVPFPTLDDGTPTSTGASNRPFITLSALLEAGVITPLSASEANPPVYDVTTQIFNLYANQSTPKMSSSCAPTSSTTNCYLSFVPYDRSHFYRNYAGGLRLKIYGRDFTDSEYRFPAIADLTLGQSEYVTGGMLRHLVLHLGGWVPVPRVDGVYMFGSMDTSMDQGTKGQQLLLTPAPSSENLTYTSPSVYVVSVSQPNRDRYRFGFGVDLFHLLPKVMAPKTATPAAATSAGQ